MREGELVRVEPLAGQPQPLGQRRVAAVQRITHTRMPMGRHVHPDLMGSTGLEMDLQQLRTGEGLDRLVVRHRLFAVGDDGELPRVRRV